MEQMSRPAYDLGLVRALRPLVDGLAGHDLNPDARDWAAISPRRIDAEQWTRFETLKGPKTRWRAPGDDRAAQ
jgi:hypothetical protein